MGAETAGRSFREGQKTAPAAHLDIKEVGRVKAVREFIISVAGLLSCINGQVVEFQRGGLGIVMGFTGDETQVLLLGAGISVRIGDEVYNKAWPLLLPVSDSYLGRIVSSLCDPLDGLGELQPGDLYPVFRDAPGVMQRVPVHDTLETGTLLIDAVIPIARGQRQLLIGDRLTGKTSVALDAIISQKGKGVVCVYICIGKPYASLVKVLNLLREQDVLDYTVVVNAASSVSVGEQYLAPYVGTMIGEHFMLQGKNVLVIFDDLTKHAWIYRQISLLLERAPGREAYPGDIFYIHSQLVERAGSMGPELNNGSMTMLPIIETLQGDLTGYIPTNMISMTDGQIFFDSGLFQKGVKPPVDFGLSVSRIGNKAQWPGMRGLSKNFRLEYIQYQELLQMTRIRASGISKQAQARLRRGEAQTHLIVQDKNAPVSIPEQFIFLHAMNLGILDGLPAESMTKFKKEIFRFISSNQPDVIREIRTTRDISEKGKKALEGSLRAYVQGLSG